MEQTPELVAVRITRFKNTTEDLVQKEEQRNGEENIKEMLSEIGDV